MDRALAGQKGAGSSASDPTTRKDVMVPAYWKADGKHIRDQGGLPLEPLILRETSSQQYTCNNSGKLQGYMEKSTH